MTATTLSAGLELPTDWREDVSYRSSVFTKCFTHFSGQMLDAVAYCHTSRSTAAYKYRVISHSTACSTKLIDHQHPAVSRYTACTFDQEISWYAERESYKHVRGIHPFNAFHAFTIFLSEILSHCQRIYHCPSSLWKFVTYQLFLFFVHIVHNDI